MTRENPSLAGANQDILTAAKGGGVSFLGRIFEYVIRFIFGVVIARAIGVEQYGLYTLGITVALIAVNVAMLGLQVGMVRFLPSAIREKDDAAISEIIKLCVGLPVLFSLALAAGMFLFATPLAELIFHDLRLVPILRIASLLVPLDTLGSMAYVVTISFKRPEYSTLTSNVISPLAKLFLAVGFLALGLSTRGVLISQVIASAAGLTLLLYYTNALFSLKRSFLTAKHNRWEILSYSFPAYLGWIVNTVRTTLATLVLGWVGLTAGVGVFTAASRFSMIGSMFYLSIGNISTPIFADLHSRGAAFQMKAYYQTTTRWMVIFNLPVFLTSMLFARPLLSIFGDDFTAGSASMMILAAGTLAYTCTGFGANILDMTDHPRVNTANSVLMVIITIILNLIFIPRWGVVGAAIATALSTVLVNVVCLLEVWYLLRMLPYNASFLKPIVAGVVAAGFSSLILVRMSLGPIVELLFGGSVLWGVYLLVLIGLKLSQEDLLIVDRLLARLRFRQVIQNLLGP